MQLALVTFGYSMPPTDLSLQVSSGGWVRSKQLYSTNLGHKYRSQFAHPFHQRFRPEIESRLVRYLENDTTSFFVGRCQEIGRGLSGRFF